MSRSMIPNSTQVPDILLDYWMAHLSGAEFKVILYVARRTYGFGKEGDTISLSQIVSGILTRDGKRLDYGTGLSKDTVCKSLAALEHKGLILRQQRENARYGDLPTYYRVSPDAPCPEERAENPPHPCTEKQTGESRFCAPPVSDYADTPVSEKSDTQESGFQETVRQETALQETAATEGRRVTPQHNPSAAAAALVEALVASGLNRSAATCLAQKKPEECRRQLEYLPFMTGEFKSSQGAFLRSAIEDGFAPPKAYQEAQKRQEQARKASSEKQRAQARSAHKERFQNTYVEYLRAKECELQENALEAYEAFQKAETIQRDQILRGPFAARTTILARILDDYDSESRYFQRLVTFFQEHSGSDLLLDFWRWDQTLNPQPFEPSPQ